MNDAIILGVIFGLIFHLIFDLIWKCYIKFVDHKWNLMPLDNFPFIWHGKEYWYSRACATVLGVFCKDKKGNIYILANKRGEGTPDYQGYWNIPCGYMQFNVSGEENAVKEVKEECGIDVNPDNVVFINAETNPSANKQNITLRYATMLDGTIDDYKFDTSGMEDGEVSDVAWILVNDKSIAKYKWAFNHNTLIKTLYDKFF